MNKAFLLLASAQVLGAFAVPAHAQMYQLYLDCKGEIIAGGHSKPADIQLALRDNNMTALIQRSNVLPVGDKMKYTASQSHYTATYVTPLYGTYVTNWHHSWMFVWYPDFKRLKTTRLSIDRQTADLEGEMLGSEDELLGRMKMRCVPQTEADMPEPKF